jgi:hypothetical protein
MENIDDIKKIVGSIIRFKKIGWYGSDPMTLKSQKDDDAFLLVSVSDCQPSWDLKNGFSGTTYDYQHQMFWIQKAIILKIMHKNEIHLIDALPCDVVVVNSAQS